MTEIALLVIFPVLMAYAGASDLLTLTIPNRLSLALIGGFGLLAILGGLSAEAFLMHVAAAGLVLVVTFGLFAFGWIGGGDAKLAAATSLWLGFGTLPDYLMLTAIVGGVLTIFVLALRHAPLPPFAHRWAWLTRLQDQKSGVPYGIALAAAALTVYPQTEIWAGALAR